MDTAALLLFRFSRGWETSFTAMPRVSEHSDPSSDLRSSETEQPRRLNCRCRGRRPRDLLVFASEASVGNSDSTPEPVSETLLESDYKLEAPDRKSRSQAWNHPEAFLNKPWNLGCFHSRFQSPAAHPNLNPTRTQT